jgi:hypothetical protein
MAKGFNCKKCGKPFFVWLKDLKEASHSKEVRKYERQGYKMVDVPAEVVGDITKWCDCK